MTLDHIVDVGTTWRGSDICIVRHLKVVMTSSFVLLEALAVQDIKEVHGDTKARTCSGRRNCFKQHEKLVTVKLAMNF